MRSLSRSLGALLAAAAVLTAASCGSGEGAGAGADPAALVPARAPVYVEATLRPGGDQADAVRTLSRKLAGVDDPGAEIRKAIERAARDDDPGFSFDKDVSPWLGDRAGVFVANFRQTSGSVEADAAVIVATKDAGKARSFVEDEIKADKSSRFAAKTYRDVKYALDSSDDTAIGVVEDRLVLGTDAGLRAAVDSIDGDKLADADGFRKARDAVGGDGLGFAYIGIARALGQLGPQGAAAGSALASVGDTVALRLTASDDEIGVDTAQLGIRGDAVTGTPGEVLASLPGDAWLAAGVADLGAQLRRSLDQVSQLAAFGGVDANQLLAQVRRQTGIDLRRDLIDWMGDAGLFVRGDSPQTLGGALVVRTKDRAATRRAIPRIGRFLRTQGDFRVSALRRPDVDAGLTLRDPSLPIPIHVALAGDRFVLAATDGGLDGALTSAAPLGDGQAFKDAAGRLSGLQPSVFVNPEPIGRLLDTTGAARDPQTAEVRDVLAKLTAIAGGTKRDGETAKGRFVVGVK